MCSLNFDLIVCQRSVWKFVVHNAQVDCHYKLNWASYSHTNVLLNETSPAWLTGVVWNS